MIFIEFLKKSWTIHVVEHTHAHNACTPPMQALPAESQADLLSKELWVGDHLQSYKQEQEEEMKVKMADSGKHKMYRWAATLTQSFPSQSSLANNKHSNSMFRSEDFLQAHTSRNNYNNNTHKPSTALNCALRLVLFIVLYFVS